MRLQFPASHESNVVGSAIVRVNDQITSVQRSCGRSFLFLLLERNADNTEETNWFCSLGGYMLGTTGLNLSELYEHLAESSPIPEDWYPFAVDEPLSEAITDLQWELVSWNEVTGQANLVVVRAQNPSSDDRCRRRFVNGKTVPPENDDQDDFDLIKTLIGIDPTQPLF
ncbi:MAG: hypothetical protein Q7S64_03235 [bacterium]|nr:hypothetical protein [bacterium]